MCIRDSPALGGPKLRFAKSKGGTVDQSVKRAGQARRRQERRTRAKAPGARRRADHPTGGPMRA
eukprot:13361328-Alexandrium_andersonii.AAC.1